MFLLVEHEVERQKIWTLHTPISLFLWHWLIVLIADKILAKVVNTK